MNRRFYMIAGALTALVQHELQEAAKVSANPAVLEILAIAIRKGLNSPEKVAFAHRSRWIARASLCTGPMPSVSPISRTNWALISRPFCGGSTGIWQLARSRQLRRRVKHQLFLKVPAAEYKSLALTDGCSRANSMSDRWLSDTVGDWSYI
jgi:hypothetical protein